MVSWGVSPQWPYCRCALQCCLRQAVAQPEGVTANPKHPQLCRKWSVAICSQIPAPFSRWPFLAGCSSGPISYTALVWELCSFSNQGHVRDLSSHAFGIAPKQSCWPEWKYPQANFNLGSGVFFRSLGWVVGRAWRVSWGHAACRDVHTPVSAQTLRLGGGTLGMGTGDLFPSPQHKTRLWIKRRL